MNNTLLSSYSGIKTHQFGLDSISNNIANVNTIGYRESTPEFETLFAPSSSISGGVTSNEVNLGVKASSNAISTKSGNYRVSDGDFHMAYQGKGWFVVGDKKDGELEVGDGKLTQKQQNFFTRDGSFGKDRSGFLVNAQGYYVYGVDLGKIKDGEFVSSPKEDSKNLSSNKLSAIQIPQDLKFSPLATTQVDLALNLNPIQNPTNAYKVFSDNGKINEEKFFNANANIFFNQGNPLDPKINNEASITLQTPQGEQTYTFTYGEQGTQNNQFQTLGELKNLIQEKTGLSLNISMQNINSKDQMILTLSNPTNPQSKISTHGSFFQALGMNGKDDGIMPDIQPFLPNQTYQPNELASYLGITFRKIGDTQGNPLENPSGWEIADTKNIPAYQEGQTYQEGSVVSKDGNIYVMGKNNQFDKIGVESTLKIPEYNPQNQYGTNTLVTLNGATYQRIGSVGNSNPLEDTTNWKELSLSKIQSHGLEVPHYQSSVEIFDENGKKYQLISDFYLTERSDSQTQDSQKWDVYSKIVDIQSQKELSPPTKHQISFDQSNTSNMQPIELDFNGKKIAYNLNGTENKKSSDKEFSPSEIIAVNQDGKSAGILQSTAIDENGIIYLQFSNGVQEAMGRIGVMTFTNDQGLSKMGGNLFGLETIVVDGEKQLKSGNPILGWNQMGDLQYGHIKQGYLETSNVDVGNALTELILMQRGYAMNAKTFSAGDEMIKEAINLKK